MKKSFIITFIYFFLLAIGCRSANPAEANDNKERKNDSAKEENGLYLPDIFNENTSKLLNSWYLKYHTKPDDEKTIPDSSMYVSDSTYESRLAKLPNIIELPYNDVVKDCIDLYANRRRDLTEYMLGMANIYFPIIEQTLDENRLPIELKYLAAVESSLNPNAVSRMGATGIWQFMLPTGKSYGLEINSLVDERRDPVKASEAACKYFKDMYKIYKDWTLVIASYNCGPGNVNKAIRKSGGQHNFWEIYQYLPKETRTYVPLFVAANYIMNFYQKHGIIPLPTKTPIYADTVIINKKTNFDKISEILHIDKNLIEALNPQYKKDIVPGNAKPYILRLPPSFAYEFSEKRDSIYKNSILPATITQRNYIFTASKYKKDNESTSDSSQNKTKDPGLSENEEIKRHRIERGETLSSIAEKYDVTVEQLKIWNDLISDRISRGRNLIVYFSKTSESDDSQNYSQPKAGDASLSARIPNKSATNNNHEYKNIGNKIITSFSKYRVKSGDTWYSISRNYPGMTAKKLMRINKLERAALKVGEEIKVPEV